MSDLQTRINNAKEALERGDALTALTRYLSISQESPDDPLLFLGQGMAYCQLQQIPQALNAFRLALSLDANNPGVAFAIADSLQRAQQIPLAEQVYRDILKNCPEHLPCAHNLGALLYSEERFEEAVERYRSALLHHPQQPSLQRDLGQALIASGQLEAGIEILAATEQQLTDKNQPEELRLTRFALSLAYLRNKDWVRGWPLYEARWTTNELHEQEKRWGKRWDGGSLIGKHLLVIAEQGYGDSLMFGRYIPSLAEEAAMLTCIVPEALRKLFSNALDCRPNVVVTSHQNFVSQHDHFIFMGSLAQQANHPDRLRPQCPPPAPFQLKPAPSLPSFKLKKPCIGLVWRGQSKCSTMSKRSMPLQKILLKLPFSDCSYVSLQLDRTAEEKQLLENFGIEDLSSQINDFQDTANLVSQLDGMLCIDTAIAHLAGNLNKPLFLLLRKEGEWRWEQNQGRTAWYENIQDGWRALS